MVNITHNVKTSRFEVVIDGHIGFLSYEVIDDNTLNYNHTIIPRELGGRGLGTTLVKFALEYARDHHKRIVPNCSFVANYISKHDECQTLLV